MKFKEQPLQTFHLRNFKAVRDSGVIKFTPLTVFIGNNGSGKSSLIEGLETFQAIVTDGLDEAMNRWRGFEFIWNKTESVVKKQQEEGGLRRRLPENKIYHHNSIEFDLKLSRFEALTRVASLPGANEIHIERERYYARNGLTQVDKEGLRRFHFEMVRGANGVANQIKPKDERPRRRELRLDESLFSYYQEEFIQSWQFLSLNSELMGEPRPAKRTGATLSLQKDGANIADYLADIFQRDTDVFNGILQTLRYVLPYAKDIQSTLTSELGRQRYLQMSEGKEIKIPGWLLSTGTLRVLTLLAVLRHPNPPPLLFIEEIENGLDPRTLNLIVEEIRYATESGRTQVVVTTHSPYLLDLLHLSQIIVVERDESGQPIFFRPDEKQLGDWAREFAPGQLYTMSQLQRPTKGDAT